jgi:hypothetical protein
LRPKSAGRRCERAGHNARALRCCAIRGLLRPSRRNVLARSHQCPSPVSFASRSKAPPPMAAPSSASG